MMRSVSICSAICFRLFSVNVPLSQPIWFRMNLSDLFLSASVNVTP